MCIISWIWKGNTRLLSDVCVWSKIEGIVVVLEQFIGLENTDFHHFE